MWYTENYEKEEKMEQSAHTRKEETGDFEQADVYGGHLLETIGKNVTVLT